MGNDQPTLRTLFACESGPYNIPKVRTLCHQNSYLVRVSVELHAFHADELRKQELSFQSFKSRVESYYHSATLTVFDQENPQTWKSVCLKCHKTRQLTATMKCCS